MNKIVILFIIILKIIKSLNMLVFEKNINNMLISKKNNNNNIIIKFDDNNKKLVRKPKN